MLTEEELSEPFLYAIVSVHFLSHVVFPYRVKKRHLTTFYSLITALLIYSMLRAI